VSVTSLGPVNPKFSKTQQPPASCMFHIMGSFRSLNPHPAIQVGWSGVGRRGVWKGAISEWECVEED
jgi:hypothetical protein